ncbi:hypothetical protein GALL_462010 [mine drainage metagenome]|uniref:Uncharacterized protein n=1 Tax=mine drainage metagenome TaxID=410659 RepID=A0A1J5PWG6_9ZZZZ
MLVRAVVVGDDGAGADVHPRAHCGVAHVGEVIGLGSVAQRGVFHLDEIADVHPVGQRRGGAQPGEGADQGVGTDRRTVEMAEGMDDRPCADAHIAQHGIGADAHAVPQMHVALEHAAHVDEHVAAAMQMAAHVQPGRVGERHPEVEQAVGGAVLQHPLQVGELTAVVDAEHVVGVVHRRGAHLHAICHGQRNHVGQVILALRVVVAQASQPALQMRHRRAQNAGIAFVNGTLRGAGVLVFDDALHRTVRVAQNAAIAVRMREFHGEQGQRSGLCLGDQRQQAARRNQRHVAIQHQADAVGRQQRHRLLHRVAGAELRLLQGEAQAGPARECGLHLVRAESGDDHGGLRLQSVHRIEHVREQRTARERLQHLRQV